MRDSGAEQADHPSRRLVRVPLGKLRNDVGEQPQAGEGIDERMRSAEDDSSKNADEQGNEGHEDPPEREIGCLFNLSERAVAQADEA